MRIVTSPLRALAAILVWLSFVGMASLAHAQGPTPTPTGPSAMLPLGPPARITVHPRPRLHELPWMLSDRRSPRPWGAEMFDSPQRKRSR
jgi:hypothetical protein